MTEILPKTASSTSPLLVGASEIADYLGVSRRTVYHLTANGALPIIRIGGQICCRPVTLETWFDEQERASMSAFVSLTDAKKSA